MTIEEYTFLEDIKKDTTTPIIDKMMVTFDYFKVRNFDDEYWYTFDEKDFLEDIEKYQSFFHINKVKTSINVIDITLGNYIDWFEYSKKGNWNGIRETFKYDDDMETILSLNSFMYDNVYKVLEKQHPLIYTGDTVKESDKELIEKLDGNERKKLEEMKRNEEMKQQFSWSHFVYILCEENLANYKQIINTPVFLAHLWFSIKLMKAKNML